MATNVSRLNYEIETDKALRVFANRPTIIRVEHESQESEEITERKPGRFALKMCSKMSSMVRMFSMIMAVIMAVSHDWTTSIFCACVSVMALFFEVLYD